MLAGIFLVLAAAGWFYWLAACALVWAYFPGEGQKTGDRRPGSAIDDRRPATAECHGRRQSVASSRPPGRYAPPAVSVLKPLKGLDAELYDNLASFCRQEYEEYELIFGMADEDDPAIQVVERLKAKFRGIPIQMIVAPAIYVNRKAGLLHALAAHARYPILAVSDSDTRVEPDYIRRVVAPLADPGIGLVTCLYRAQQPQTFAARLEALYIGATFLPSVLVARQLLGMRFAMGATVALRHSDLDRIGGFRAVADYLADDYQLGARIAELGLRVHLSDVIVDIVLGATSFGEQWDREVRWAHCSRASRPGGYAGLFITYTLPWAVFCLLASGLSAWAWGVVGASLAVRWLVAWLVMLRTEDRAARRWLVWLPVRDMLTTLVWMAGAVGKRVVWRGESYILTPDGLLSSPRPAHHRPWQGSWRHLRDGHPSSPLPQRGGPRGGQPSPLPQHGGPGGGHPSSPLPQRGGPRGGLLRLARRPVIWLDALLRRIYHIRAFSDDESCMLRLSLTRADRDLTLPDGTIVHRGDPVCEVHFWNQRLPAIPATGANLAWALAFRHRLAHSFRLLAAYLDENPALDRVQAILGRTSFTARYPVPNIEALFGHLGFDLVACDEPAGLWHRFLGFWERGYAVALMWAFNPNSVRHGRLPTMRRDQLWMSRRALVCKYGRSAPSFPADDECRRPQSAAAAGPGGPTPPRNASA